MRHLLALSQPSRCVAGSLVVVSLGAQSSTPAPAAAPAGWKVPRTPDGRPDLQGVWGNNSVTPMTRPAAVEGQGRRSPTPRSKS